MSCFIKHLRANFIVWRSGVKSKQGIIPNIIQNKEKLRERFLRDPLPKRLGGLSATLGRISSSARNSTDATVVKNLLKEAKYLIEWTAAETVPETAAELVSMQTLITLWIKAWDTSSQEKIQRTLLSVQAK